MTEWSKHTCLFASTIAIVVMSASLATAGIVTQYSFENDLTDSGADGITADDLTDEEQGGGPGLAEYVAGVVGQAASINGLAGVLVAEDSVDLDLVGNFTIDVFLNPTSYNAWNRLILKWGNGHDYHVSLKSEKVDLHDSNVTNVINAVGPAITLAEWHHIGISNDASDSTSGLKTYVDGQLVDETAGITLDDGTDRLGLGNSPGDDHGGRGYTGRQDELRIHDEAQDLA